MVTIKRYFIKTRLKIYRKIEQKRIFTNASEERKKFNYRKFYLKYSPSICDLYICSICGKIINEKRMQVDHIIPLAVGGPNRWLNTVAACATCNNMKSDILSLQYVVKGIICKGLEILILGLKFIFLILIFGTYNILRSIFLILICPIKSKRVHWFTKLVYLRVLLELVK